MATALPTPDIQRVTLHDISWDTYESLLRDTGNSGVRMTYDRGELEIMMSPSFPHERYDRFLDRVVYKLAELTNLAVECGGAVTQRRSDLRRAVEPDSCYWIEHEPLMRGRTQLDLSVDPPPDLVVEIDITSSSVDRINIYCEMGVPEVWHLSTAGFEILVLNDAGQYEPATCSRSSPLVSADILRDAIDSVEELGQTEALRRLVAALTRT